MGEYSVKDIQDADVPDYLVQCLLAKVYISVKLYVHLHTNWDHIYIERIVS